MSLLRQNAFFPYLNPTNYLNFLRNFTGCFNSQKIKTISKMGWLDIVEYILLSAIVIVNSVTLVLLKRGKHSVRIKNQINIVAALCLNRITSVPITFLFYVMKYNEIEGHMSSIFKNVFLCMSYIFVMLNYYFMIILLTIDQFLVF